MTAEKIVIFGIKNCDKVRKMLAFCDGHHIAYDFHDYKKQGVDRDVLARAFDQHGWEQVINRRGTTWKKLPESVRESMSAETAMAAAIENPSLIKRPMILHGNHVILGFDELACQVLLSLKAA